VSSCNLLDPDENPLPVGEYETRDQYARAARGYDEGANDLVRAPDSYDVPGVGAPVIVGWFRRADRTRREDRLADFYVRGRGARPSCRVILGPGWWLPPPTTPEDRRAARYSRLLSGQIPAAVQEPTRNYAAVLADLRAKVKREDQSSPAAVAPRLEMWLLSCAIRENEERLARGQDPV
jgi:hypothetical protein